VIQQPYKHEFANGNPTIPNVIADDLMQRLLASIASDSLVILCGAGLSMAGDCEISSAWHVAQSCAQTYRMKTGFDLPKGLAEDIESMAEYFFEREELESVLFKLLIDWSEFHQKTPNTGHVTIADFLAARVCSLVLSTNLDTMIEKAAEKIGEPDFFPTVRETDLNQKHNHAPLLKIHGCATRSRNESLWCKNQLERDPLKTRIPALVRWMQGYIPNRTLLIVGFWTDWLYLNKVLEDAIASTEPRCVILVDPDSDEKLEAKSPALWKWAKERTNFIHIRSSGDKFLEELRWRVSYHHIWQAWQKGREIFSSVLGGEAPSDPVAILQQLANDDLYDLRRDLCGVPSNAVVRDNAANESQALIGALQLAIGSIGALDSHLFNLEGESLRLLNTPNRPISAVKKLFSAEPPDPSPPNRTICVGAIDDGGVPEDIIGRGEPQAIIRNTLAPSWETHERLLTEVRTGYNNES
jgi:hypothetical protein